MFSGNDVILELNSQNFHPNAHAFGPKVSRHKLRHIAVQKYVKSDSVAFSTRSI